MDPRNITRLEPVKLRKPNRKGSNLPITMAFRGELAVKLQGLNSWKPEKMDGFQSSIFQVKGIFGRKFAHLSGETRWNPVKAASIKKDLKTNGWNLEMLAKWPNPFSFKFPFEPTVVVTNLLHFSGEGTIFMWKNVTWLIITKWSEFRWYKIYNP